VISTKQANQICAFCIACVVFILAVAIAHKIQSTPDFTLPVKEIPLQYR
tara:strand:- start:7975 stop:8121 length:147 start_codon:yes stop_codon:yes gene_type:complete